MYTDTSFTAVPKNWKLPYCLTEKCIHTASYMLSSMNQNANPCENFYEFACGRWVLSNPIPDGRSLWGMFNQPEQENQLVIKNVLGTSNLDHRLNYKRASDIKL